MVPPRKRNVARSPEDLARKRNRILDAAMELLLEKGYTRTTVSDVARRADMGRGTLYWHFESKDALFLSVLEREANRIDAMLEPLLQGEAPAADKLAQFIQGSFLLLDQVPNLFTAFMHVLSGAGEDVESSLLEWFTDVYRRYNRHAERLLTQARDEGVVSEDLDIPVAAAAIVSLIDAMYLQIEMGLVPRDPARVSRAVLGLLREGYTRCEKEGDE